MEIQDREQEIETQVGEVRRQGRSGAGIAWLALLLALSVAVFTGWRWWQDRASGDAAAESAAAVNSLRGEMLEMGRQLEDLQSGQEDVQTAALELDRIDAELKGVVARLDQANATRELEREKSRELEAAYADLADRALVLESSLAALVVRGESSGKRIELAEIEFLLRNASERLQLFGDRRGALQALDLADAQLEALDDPLYLPVRQAVASARLDLQAMPVVDTVGLTQRLGRLQSGIPGLPFPGEKGVADAALVAETAAAAEAGIWERFKAALSGLVTVRRRVDEEELISIEDKEYVRQGLWLQLESARLALLRSDQDAYDASLQRAASTLGQYFDASAPSVKSALDSLAELADSSLNAVPPDISAPWGRLNDLREEAPAVALPPAEMPDDGE